MDQDIEERCAKYMAKIKERLSRLERQVRKNPSEDRVAAMIKAEIEKKSGELAKNAAEGNNAEAVSEERVMELIKAE